MEKTQFSAKYKVKLSEDDQKVIISLNKIIWIISIVRGDTLIPRCILVAENNGRTTERHINFLIQIYLIKIDGETISYLTSEFEFYISIFFINIRAIQEVSTQLLTKILLLMHVLRHIINLYSYILM